MNETQAKTAMRKLFGTSAMWRRDESAPKADEREAIRATLPDLRAAFETAKKARDARREELLADPEYRRLVAEASAADDALKHASSMSHHYRVTVGKDRGICFEVVGQGDNWQEAIDAARAKVRP